MSDLSENQPEIALCDDGDDELGEEEIISTDFHGGSTEENKLDEVMGVLQDVLIDPDFVQLQTDFCQKHCEYFDDASENKLIYMDLFKEYTLLIENYLEARLQAEIEDFSMDELCQMIQDHEDDIAGDVVDILMSCTDFDEFKSLMLSFKQNDHAMFEIQGDSLICN
ncbi:hypothetical protein H310_14819 [Aphanomyces invadans]|uniref:ADP-ribosylation factor-like protein 2-binding protein n=1 Tax=Aphanomyces invadans TaxID=157072 RepID=A0A024T9X5_9STRA|nr:hypothetical protein H310_14819 [Aphanomyces invadans]ETV90391.1 hypothetical protein H310_14819 [Aphanomyces invadans]|eukprot:XP_008880973.1 hypothetical protein H310_14819 [Aphanomyces invadans]